MIFPHRGWLRGLLCVTLGFVYQEVATGQNQIAFERMGAGIPAGWRVTGQNFSWTAQPGAGPAGTDAARLSFTQKGSVKLESPAFQLKVKVAHGQIWCRSEPPGAKVELQLRDNGHFPRGSTSAPLSNALSTTERWQCLPLEGALPRSDGNHYYLEVEVASEGQTVWLEGLSLGSQVRPLPVSKEQSGVPSAGITLRPQAAWGLVTAHEPMRAQACVVGATVPGAKLRVRTVHTSGTVEDQPMIALDGQPLWNGMIEVTGKPANLFGMTRLEATVVDSNNAPISATAETLLARVPAPVPGPLTNSPFGIHVGFREPELTVAAKLGYKWCRAHDASGATKWGRLEIKPGEWSWQDESIAAPGKHGMSILGMLDSCPPWASGVTEDGYWSIYGAPREIEPWRKYVKAMASRYAGVIDRWEVWNEPWLNAGGFRFFQNGIPQRYQQLLQIAFAEAKQVNPKAQIVGIDTFPAAWDQAVLAAGAYPYFDALSFHRYDHSLHGQPGDLIAREADRLRNAQSAYGPAKPLELTEGGPDVALFHGSFFSFADPHITGDWQRGADQYARMFLGVIAAGIQRFTAYSIHGVPRHGDQTHMMVEPGPLLRTMHLTVSALAQFVEGANYEGRLNPEHDITAHVFSQPNARYFCAEASTVVALIANGEAPEPLPRSIPAGVHCFDRWGNPIPAPVQAVRGITYLVATGQARAALLEALKPAPQQPAWDPGVDGLLKATLKSLNDGDPDMWELFSSSGSFAAIGKEGAPLMASRETMRNSTNLAIKLRIQGIRSSSASILVPAGESVIGWTDLEGDSHSWSMAFTAIPDGPQGKWRLVTLVMVPRRASVTANDMKDARQLLTRWEKGVGQGDVLSLRDTLAEPAICASFAMPYPQILMNPDYFTTFLHGMVVHGVKRSAQSITHMIQAGDLAAVDGTWEVETAFTGPLRLAMGATLLRQGELWRVVTLSLGPSPTAAQPADQH